MALFPVTVGDPYLPQITPISVTSRQCMKTAEQIELVFAQMLPLAYPTLCWKGIRVSPKIRVLPSRTYSHTLELENFATARRSSWMLST